MTIEMPEVVTVRDRKLRRPETPDDTKPLPPPPANDDYKSPNPSAVVTIRRTSRFGRAEDITMEEVNRRADLA